MSEFICFGKKKSFGYFYELSKVFNSELAIKNLR